MNINATHASIEGFEFIIFLFGIVAIVKKAIVCATPL